MKFIRPKKDLSERHQYLANICWISGFGLQQAFFFVKCFEGDTKGQRHCCLSGKIDSNVATGYGV